MTHRVKYSTISVHDDDDDHDDDNDDMQHHISLSNTKLEPMEIHASISPHTNSHPHPPSYIPHPHTHSIIFDPNSLHTIKHQTCPFTITRIRNVAWRRKWIILLTSLLFFLLWIWARLTGRLPSVTGKVMVVYARHGFPWAKAQPGQGTASGTSRWAGMFSEVTSVLGALHYAQIHGAVGVRVMMDSENLIDSPEDNWWDYYFINPMMLQDVTDASEVHMNGWIAKYGRFGGFGHLIFGDTYDIQSLYPIRIGMHRYAVNRLITSYVRIKPEIENWSKQYWLDHVSKNVEYTLAVHYRGLDSKFHYPYYNIPYETMLSIIDEILTLYAPHKTYNIFIATDEIEFITYMNGTKHAQHLRYVTSAPRAHVNGSALHFSDVGMSRRERGASAVRDMLLLSYGNYLIKTRSSISDTSVVWNPHLPYTYVIGTDEIYHSKDYQKPEILHKT